MRGKEEIAQRAVALAMVASRGEGLALEEFKQLVNRSEAKAWFTPKERLTVFKETLTDQERINCTWRYEARMTLVWALGCIIPLERPDKICNPAQIVG